MDKRGFMKSMISMEEMVLNIDSAARSLALKTVLGKGGKVNKAETNKLTDSSDEILKNTKKAFDLIQKSIKAFFKSNKEPHSPSNYSDIADSFRKRNVVAGGADVLLSNINIVCAQVVSEAKLNSGAKVHHNNGVSWVKTKADQKRFASIAKIASDISSIVSK